MGWSDYMIMAARHSRTSAAHWFRYLRRDIDKCGVLFTKEDVDALYNNEALTPFQRVSIKAAFQEGSPTRLHIINLNNKTRQNKIQLVRGKIENSKLHEQ